MTEQYISHINQIGSLDSCPYCAKALIKIPNRKVECPFCNELIYVKTRPTDQARVLVTEEQWVEFLDYSGLFDSIYEIIRGLRFIEGNFMKHKLQLTEKFGRTPSDNDIYWSMVQENKLKNYKQGVEYKNWGPYANCSLSSAAVLLSENKYLEAANYLAEACLFDYYEYGRLDAYVLSDALQSVLKLSDKSESDLVDILKKCKEKLPMLADKKLDLDRVARAVFQPE
jgi:DNA-directed RNA polymerase subunit RPC12/RpoP